MEDIAGYSDDQVGAAVRELARSVPRRRCPLRHAPARHRRRRGHVHARRPRRTRTSSSSSATCRPRHPRAASSAIRDGAPPRWTCRLSPASRTRPSSLPRKSKSSKRAGHWNRIRHRNRPGHHQLRARLCGRDAQCGPLRARQRPVAGRPATGEPGRGARRRPAALVPLSAGRVGFPRRHASRCPGTPTAHYVVGRLAQKRGVENAGRLVSSAKSWLSHSGVDRTSPLLPFRAPEGVERISPRRSQPPLSANTFARRGTRKMPDAPFTAQQVLVTVPGVVRRGGARADARSGEARRISEHHAARRAAGRVLCLDRAPSRLARARAASAT